MILLCEDGSLRQAATVPVVVNFGTVSLSLGLSRFDVSQQNLLFVVISIFSDPLSSSGGCEMVGAGAASSYSSGAPLSGALPGKGEWDG